MRCTSHLYAAEFLTNTLQKRLEKVRLAGGARQRCWRGPTACSHTTRVPRFPAPQISHEKAQLELKVLELKKQVGVVMGSDGRCRCVGTGTAPGVYP